MGPISRLRCVIRIQRMGRWKLGVHIEIRLAEALYMQVSFTSDVTVNIERMPSYTWSQMIYINNLYVFEVKRKMDKHETRQILSLKFG
jgi:hypothetical protein